MISSLRILKNWFLIIEQDKLNPKIGCGLVLFKIPRYYPNKPFQQALAVYNIKTVFADKEARLLLENDSIIKGFCQNAQSGNSLNDNIRAVFSPHKILALMDPSKESSWFLQSPENRLPWLNYYKDIVPNFLKKNGIVLTGSLGRLMPLGWQNLYDVVDQDFIKNYPQVKSIEILTVIADTRWRYPVLSIGINILNIKSADAVREKIVEIMK